jgi:hypothetical protein
MSESLVGFDVAATRQNPGSWPRAWSRPPSGKLTFPAGTLVANVTVAFSKDMEDSL